MVDVIKEFSEWRQLVNGPLTGGLNTDLDTELLESNELVVATNAVFRHKELAADTGYVTFNQVVRGDPVKIVEYINPLTNGVELVLITALTVYIHDGVALQWQYASNGTETTLSANEAGGQTVLSVTSIAGFADNDFVGVMLDTGQMHFSQVNGAPAGSEITIDDALPSAAASGKAVIKASVLAGSASFPVTAVQIPWTDQLVFTNGVNNIKIFDPSVGLNGSVTDLTGTGLGANIKCQTLALFDNSLILANIVSDTETSRFRFRYSAKGDITLWNTLEAGFTDLLDGLGVIKQALGLGPYLILYRADGITRVNIGGAGRFTPDASVTDAGVHSSVAAIDFIDKHLVWGRNKFFWYRAGFSIEELHCSIKDSIWGKTGDIKAGFIGLTSTFMFPILYHNEVIFSYGANITARPYPRYNLDTNKWSRRAFGAAAHRICGYGIGLGSSASEAGRVFIGESVGDQVYVYNLDATVDGATNISFDAQTKDFSHPSYLITHDSLEVSLSGNGTVTVDFSVNKGASWTNLGAITATATPTSSRLFKQFTARTIRFRFTTTNPVVIAFLNMHYKYTAQW